MISCTEFIPAYSELFKYIHEKDGYDAVQVFWKWLFKPDGKGIPLINFIKKDGLQGAFNYWSGTLTEEAADITRYLNLKQGWMRSCMHYCPSKGRLLKLKEELGVEPYAHYCDHCDHYRAALEMGGLVSVRDHLQVDKASCNSIIYDPKVFKGMMTIDEDTVIHEIRATEQEYFHPDFHSSMNMGVEYLGMTYGEYAVKEYLTQYTNAVYRKRMDKISAEGISALADMIQETYKLEHAQEALELKQTEDTLHVSVKFCPAVRHLKKTGREVSQWYPKTTEVVMDVIAQNCGLTFQMLSYDPETGAAEYCFAKR